jgi:hypothetical protein
MQHLIVRNGAELERKMCTNTLRPGIAAGMSLVRPGVMLRRYLGHTPNPDTIFSLAAIQRPLYLRRGL